MDKSDAALRRLERLSARLMVADTRAATIRDELYTVMLEARAEGVTLSAMARVLGISRQRVQKIFERLDR